MDFFDVPLEVLVEVRGIALSLPEVWESRSPVGHEFRIRRRIFVYVFSVSTDAAPATMLVVRAAPDEREVLLRMSHPYFAPRSGRDRLGVVIDASTDWEEMAELITESYRLHAPKMLARTLDQEDSGG